MNQNVNSIHNRCVSFLKDFSDKIKKGEDIIALQLCKDYNIQKLMPTLMRNKKIISKIEGTKKFQWHVGSGDADISFWADKMLTELRFERNKTQKAYHAKKKSLIKLKTDPQMMSIKNTPEFKREISIDAALLSKTVVSDNLKPLSENKKTSEIYYTSAVLLHLQYLRFDKNFTFKYNCVEFFNVDMLQFREVKEDKIRIDILDKEYTVISKITVPFQKLYLIDKQFNDTMYKDACVLTFKL